MPRDLLKPATSLYKYQLKRAIETYGPTQLAIGELLQNAIDATVGANETSPNADRIEIQVDFDSNRVVIRDFGVGFSNNTDLLFIGGSTKETSGRLIHGRIGAGLKVVLFSSESFTLRSKIDDDHFRYDLDDAHRFAEDSPPVLESPTHQFESDDEPLNANGTEITCSFPSGEENVLHSFVKEMYTDCLIKDDVEMGFGKAIKYQVDNEEFPNRFAALFSGYLRRFTYVGDVLNSLGGKRPLSNVRIHVRVRCSDVVSTFGEGIGSLFDGLSEFDFVAKTEYLLVSDIIPCRPPHERVVIRRDELGNGGHNLDRVARGFNELLLVVNDDYEKILRNWRGVINTKKIEKYRNILFEKINGMILTIGHIPEFEESLPGGSRRLISCNGVPTTHEINITSGKNQQYVRCFDMVIDLNAKLNYGKAQLTNKILVGLIRDFVNDAYGATIQNAAKRFVGRTDSTPPEPEDVYISRDDLGIPELKIKKVPKGENDVIALFFEMLGLGYIDDIKIFGLSSQDTYDSRAWTKVLGEDEWRDTPLSDTDLKKYEFKFIANTILPEFDQGVKDIRQVDVLVAWDSVNLRSSDNYSIADVIHYPHPDHINPGVTHYIRDLTSGEVCQLILLKSHTDRLAEN